MKEIIQGIYKIENINTGKVYIGHSKDIYTRWSQHKQMLEKGIHHSSKLQLSYTKTKDKNVFVYSIVEIIDSEFDLPVREKYYIDQYDSLYNGYNCADVGEFLTEKMIKKKKTEEKKQYYYQYFNSLYNSEVTKFSDLWMSRIKKQHYSWVEMKRLCNVLQYFYDNYFNKDNTFTMRIIPIKTQRHRIIIDNNIEWADIEFNYNDKKEYVPEYIYKGRY